jgi:hypothetical protein
LAGEQKKRKNDFFVFFERWLFLKQLQENVYIFGKIFGGTKSVYDMDQIIIKTPNPKSRLFLKIDL